MFFIVFAVNCSVRYLYERADPQARPYLPFLMQSPYSAAHSLAPRSFSAAVKALAFSMAAASSAGAAYAWL